MNWKRITETDINSEYIKKKKNYNSLRQRDDPIIWAKKQNSLRIKPHYPLNYEYVNLRNNSNCNHNAILFHIKHMSKILSLKLHVSDGMKEPK